MREWIRKKFILDRVCNYSFLINQINELNEKYGAILLDIKRLEEENIEQSNALYEMTNSLDSRIDIIYNELKGLNGDGI